jgi:membrane protease YdiL (CAAX protease family)
MAVIPFIWWSITARKKISFFQWIGFEKPIIKNKKKYTIVFGGAVVLFSTMSFAIVPMISNGHNLATSRFTNQGIGALIPALIYAFIQTGLSEEIFFRGFLGKRLIKQFGFKLGNLLQAILFGALHGFMLFSSVTIGMTIVISIFTGLIGWLMGYINEKESNGSIISSWCMHGIANFISSLVSMCGLI